MIQFISDFSANEVMPGDVVTVIQSNFQWSGERFRVTQISPVLRPNGHLQYNISAQIYDPAAYATPNVKMDPPNAKVSAKSRAIDSRIQSAALRPPLVHTNSKTLYCSGETMTLGLNYQWTNPSLVAPGYSYPYNISGVSPNNVNVPISGYFKINGTPENNYGKNFNFVINTLTKSTPSVTIGGNTSHYTVWAPYWKFSYRVEAQTYYNTEENGKKYRVLRFRLLHSFGVGGLVNWKLTSNVPELLDGVTTSGARTQQNRHDASLNDKLEFALKVNRISNSYLSSDSYVEFHADNMWVNGVRSFERNPCNPSFSSLPHRFSGAFIRY